MIGPINNNEPPSSAALKAAQQLSREAAARDAERRRQLICEYGNDSYDHGDILIFLPRSDESETRVAVKVGPDRWTLTARGSQHSWIKTLELVGSGHPLYKGGMVSMLCVRGEIDE